MAQKWVDVDIPNKQIGVQFLVQVYNILQIVEFDKFFKILGEFDGNTSKMYIHYNINQDQNICYLGMLRMKIKLKQLHI